MLLNSRFRNTSHLIGYFLRFLLLLYMLFLFNNYVQHRGDYHTDIVFELMVELVEDTNIPYILNDCTKIIIDFINKTENVYVTIYNKDLIALTPRHDISISEFDFEGKHQELFELIRLESEGCLTIQNNGSYHHILFRWVYVEELETEFLIVFSYLLLSTIHRIHVLIWILMLLNITYFLFHILAEYAQYVERLNINTRRVISAYKFYDPGRD